MIAKYILVSIKYLYNPSYLTLRENKQNKQ